MNEAARWSWVNACDHTRLSYGDTLSLSLNLSQFRVRVSGFKCSVYAVKELYTDAGQVSIAKGSSVRA